MSDSMTRDQFLGLYKQLTLAVAGVLTIYDSEDDLVWGVMGCMDQLLQSWEKKLPVQDPQRPLGPHQAVTDLLATIDKMAVPAGASN